MISYLLIFITVSSLIFSFYCYSSKKKVDNETEALNQAISFQNKALTQQRDTLDSEVKELTENYNSLDVEKQKLEVSISNKKDELSTLQETVNSTFNSQKVLSDKAFENYCQVLENKYKEVEQEYDNSIALLNESYSTIQLKAMREADECRADLDKIHATRAAAIEAQRREREIESNTSFYCIQVSELDKADIAKLEALKPSLNNKRILSMLIWQTFFQRQLKALCANIIGTDDKTGIYKITNIKTKECYVGQAVSVYTRFAEHCKAGLGIDTPANNKLYKAMQEYSLWNFSFELLEECPKEQLNEKEKYYIDLYDSVNFGYNLSKGIGK